jgi:hypothetical protein
MGCPVRAVCAAALVVLLLIVICVVACPTRRRYENLMGGMWAGDPGFLKKAELADMQIYLSPARGSSERQGYIILTDTNGGFVANQAFELTYSFDNKFVGMFRNHFRQQDRAEAHLTFSFDNPKEKPFPTDIKASLSLSDSSLTLYDGKKIYAFLYKDAAASHAANLAYDGQ